MKKINECTIDKNGNATLQDIVNYLSEDSNVTYYVALEEIALVAGEVSVGEPTKSSGGDNDSISSKTYKVWLEK